MYTYFGKVFYRRLFLSDPWRQEKRVCPLFQKIQQHAKRVFPRHKPEPECIYQCKLPDLPNQFNFENCETRMLLVVFDWRTKYGQFSRLPPETLSTKSYWCLTHAMKSTRVSTFCFFRSIYIIVCFFIRKTSYIYNIILHKYLHWWGWRSYA